MVVTRKSSHSPMPPTSRTSSTQAIPRVTKAKAQAKSPKEPEMDDIPFKEDDISDILLNAIKDEHLDDAPLDASTIRGSPVKKKPQKDKASEPNGISHPQSHKPQKRSGRLIDWISRIFLLYAVAYVATVCPSDTLHEHTVCRGLYEYRRLIVEPYVLPPIYKVLSHPTVYPYLEKAVPYYNAASHKVSPIIRQTTRVWNRQVVPVWQRQVSPVLGKIDAQFLPYRQQLSDIYEQYAGQYFRKLRIFEEFADRLQPKVLYASAKLYDGYVVSKPYLNMAGKELQRLRPIFSQYILVPFRNARQVYVDPHVAEMWEKIVELSNGKTKLYSVPAETPVSHFTSTFVLEPEAETTTEFEAPPTPLPTDEEAESVISIVASTMGDILTDSAVPTSVEYYATEVSETVLDSPTSIFDEITETLKEEATAISEEFSTVSTEVESFITASLAIPEPSQVIEEIGLSGSGASESVMDAISPEQSTKVTDIEVADKETMVPSSVTPAEVPTPYAEGDDLEIDLERFYADLGLEEETPSETGSLAPTQQVVVEETDEEKAERARLRAQETAEKRKRLEERHTHWEAELQNAIKTQRKLLRTALVAIRKAAAVDLKASVEIRDAVDNLHREAEKALKGTEAYFGKLKKEQKSDREKLNLWERLANKVEEKFQERVGEVEFVVNQWYGNVMMEEYQEVEKAANKVKDIAEDAQADIGLDYAWLDDVTYLDWRRYHALMDKYKEFREYLLTIQNGTHPSPPTNAVLTALDDLQSELQDIVVGFETRMRRIKREGERAFVQNESVEAFESRLEENGDDVAEPEVSILPVPDADVGPEEDMTSELPQIIIGRDSAEVFQAFENAGYLRDDSESEESSKEEDKVEDVKYGTILHAEL